MLENFSLEARNGKKVNQMAEKLMALADNVWEYSAVNLANMQNSISLSNQLEI